MVASAKTTAITIAVVLAVVVVLLLAFPPDIEYIFIDDVHQGYSYMQWGIAAPVIAIVLALVTKRVYTSLFIGILAGTIIYSRLDPAIAFEALFTGDLESLQGFTATFGNLENIGLCVFLILLGAMVYAMRKAGGTAALANWAREKLNTREQSQLMTILLGAIIFVDDYFNCLTVGMVMRPVTDENRVSRAKLAYLLDATAVSVCILVPISSIAAAVSGDIDTQDAFRIFLDTIPYNYYAIFTIVFMVVIILMKFDFGPMRRFEADAIKNGNPPLERSEYPASSPGGSCRESVIKNLLVPIIFLVVFNILGMLYTGYLYGGTDFFSMMGKCNACIGLPLGTFFAFIATLLFYYQRKAIDKRDAWDSIPEGFRAMFPAMLILILAWTLKGTIDLLGLDLFVADCVESNVNGLEFLIPVLVFVVGMFLSLATGTSWGTFGILIPICMALFLTDQQMMTISISACMAGAVFGDHCSPISDTTIMASTGAGCDLITHVSTQLPYAILVAAVSAICFVIAGLLQSPLIPLVTGIVLIVSALYILRILVRRKHGIPEQ